jgi:hypothetical protein
MPDTFALSERLRCSFQGLPDLPADWTQLLDCTIHTPWAATPNNDDSSNTAGGTPADLANGAGRELVVDARHNGAHPRPAAADPRTRQPPPGQGLKALGLPYLERHAQQQHSRSLSA